MLESPLVARDAGGPRKPLGRRRPRHPPGPLRRPLGVVAARDPGRLPRARRSRCSARRSAQRTLEALGAHGARDPARGRDRRLRRRRAADLLDRRATATTGLASHLTANVEPVAAARRAVREPEGARVASSERQRAALPRRREGGVRRHARAPARRATRRAHDPLPPRREVRGGGGRRPRRAAPAVQPVYDRLGATRGDEGGDRADHGDASRGAERAPRARVLPGARAGGDGRPQRPIDGVYRSEVTTAQLRRTPGLEAFEANPGNVGRFEMELTRRALRASAARRTASESDRARTRSTATASRSTFNGEGPYRYGWSLYRGALTLHMTAVTARRRLRRPPVAP